MTMRALVRPVGLTWGGGDAGMRPELKWLEISTLRIDDDYQREVTARGRRTIAAIAQAFSWAKFQALIVAPIAGEGLYVVIDGQHRTLAAMVVGYSKVPCMVVDATAADAARIFAAVNGTVTPMSILQLFKAARAAKEPWAEAVDQVCDAAGLEPLVYPVSKAKMKPYQTLAIGTLRKMIDRFGEAAVAPPLKKEAARDGSEAPGHFDSTTIAFVVAHNRPRDEVKHPVPDAHQRNMAKTWNEPVRLMRVPPLAAAAPLKPLNVTDDIRERYARGQSKQTIATQLRVPYAKVEEAVKG